VSQSGATFSNIPSNPHSGGTSAGFGLGDAISSVTHALGIPECGGCGKRREFFNRLLRISSARTPLEGYIISQENRPQ
jgi:hypothetical protein